MSRLSRYTSYRHDSAILPTTTQKCVARSSGSLRSRSPFPIYLVGLSDGRSWLILFATAFVAAIGAIGLNIISGFAGQVSLGHAFFIGVGAYTATALSNPIGARTEDGAIELIGLEPRHDHLATGRQDSWLSLGWRSSSLHWRSGSRACIWPSSRSVWCSLGSTSSGIGTSSPAASARGGNRRRLSLFGYRFDQDAEILGFFITKEQQIYWLMFFVLIVMAVFAKNVVRSKVGRAFAAVRDQWRCRRADGCEPNEVQDDGVRHLLLLRGDRRSALLFTVTGFIEPTSFNLLMSIAYIAMAVIGGLASIAGFDHGGALHSAPPQDH